MQAVFFLRLPYLLILRIGITVPETSVNNNIVYQETVRDCLLFRIKTGATPRLKKGTPAGACGLFSVLVYSV